MGKKFNKIKEKSKFVKEHLMKKSLTMFIFYPRHKRRTRSSLFVKNRDYLIDDLKTTCWICESNKNLEAHHLHEWSLWNLLDQDKVLETLRLIDPYGFTRKDPNTPIESPDDLRNLMILCRECHRGKFKGVHDLTFAIWLARRSVKEDKKIVDMKKIMKKLKRKDKRKTTRKTN